MLASLQNRVFLASALVAAVSIGVPAWVVTGQASREAEAELRRDLERAATLVEEEHASRLETLKVHARLIADLPKLKAVLATGDPPTIRPIAEDYRAMVRSRILTLTDASGEPLMRIGDPDGSPAETAAVAAALEGREATTFRADPDGVLQMVTVPIVVGPSPPEILGTLSLGFLLDDALAAQLKALTASELAFVTGGRVRASTLRGRFGDRLAAVVGTRGSVLLSLGGNEYEAVARPLHVGSADSGAPTAIVLQSRTERLRLLRRVRTALVAAALLGVLMAVLLSYGAARRVTRPLAAITASMREMTATGDLTRKIEVARGWQDEEAALLAATFNTLTDSIARFQREAALRERLSALGRLSTVIAHEVRNPLMIIKGSLRLLRGPASTEEAREAAAEIDDEVARLNRIVDDVLDFARPIRLERSLVDIGELCRDAVAAAGAAGDGVRFQLDVEPGISLISTDGERLRTALVNVLGNAKDAVMRRRERPAPGAGPDVVLWARRGTAEVLTLTVSDRGVGIPAEEMPRVFEPYFSSKRTGSGLGLAITKNIVDALGGRLSLRSQDGLGTEVRIELPITPDPSPDGTRHGGGGGEA